MRSDIKAALDDLAKHAEDRRESADAFAAALKELEFALLAHARVGDTVTVDGHTVSVMQLGCYYLDRGLQRRRCPASQWVTHIVVDSSPYATTIKTTIGVIRPMSGRYWQETDASRNLGGRVRHQHGTTLYSATTDEDDLAPASHATQVWFVARAAAIATAFAALARADRKAMDAAVRAGAGAAERFATERFDS